MRPSRSVRATPIERVVAHAALASVAVLVPPVGQHEHRQVDERVEHGLDDAHGGLASAVVDADQLDDVGEERVAGRVGVGYHGPYRGRPRTSRTASPLADCAIPPVHGWSSTTDQHNSTVVS